jgi:hypothetical protein
MPPPLLTQSPDADYPVAEPCRIRARVVAWAGAWRLDHALAGGVCPDTSATLSLRAHRLIGVATRRELAQELRDVIRRAGRPRELFDNGIRLCAIEVLDAHDAILDLADRLDDREPVEPAGVARARLLLRDGAGPLYNASYPGGLRRAVLVALDALEPRW